MWVRVLLTAALGASLGCGDEGAAVDPTTAAGGPDPCAGGGLEAGTQTFTLAHGGLERGYVVHVPEGSAGTPRPLVLNFHGFTSNATEQQAFSAMDATADAQGFVLAYPEGYESSWNGGSLCCGSAAGEQIDDVGFARAVIDDLAGRACIDRKRVYSTGMSNGGFMSHRLGCEASDAIAAIGPVAGLIGIPADSCQPSRPVPVIHFYGTEDELVDYMFADDVDAVWADRNGCSDDGTVSYQEGNVTCTTRSACEGGVEVTLCSVEGGGHCWPGQEFCPFGASTTDISANEAMWALFERFALP